MFTLFGSSSARSLGRMQKTVDEVNAREASMQTLSDAALKEKTQAFKKRLTSGESLDAILPEAFAVVREASRRTTGMRHFDVQLIGGIALHEGKIAEMKTGEGKTLVATLPVYLNALAGQGVHVVTVNDYLSRRDAVWMGEVYAFLGLTVGVVGSQFQSFLYDPAHRTPNADGDQFDAVRDQVAGYKVVYDFLRPCSKREAYAADITYGTNNEFGFDYLRDNIVYAERELAQRGFHFAIVDEIDSILIDEARTPLIISAPAEDSDKLYRTFTDIARRFKRDEDFIVDEKMRAVTLTDAGIEKTERALGIGNMYTSEGVKLVHHLETAVRAYALYRRDTDYVVKNDEVIIVDEFTGRLMPGRRWSEGLHQAIEAKEGVAVQRESRTFATITFQNYFRMYKRLSGMTGTASTSSEEFYKVYGLEVVEIPTNAPVVRIDRNDLIYQSEGGKLAAVVAKVSSLKERGQPVLLGTVSIEKNELLSRELSKAGIAHEVLNAKNHEREGEIIAQAGIKGGVTVATNMAGRGVDIKLGGNPVSLEAYEEVKRLGGLFVLGTERHEARRIDNQLRGRSGRQGDPGETQFFVSLEDSLMRIFASDVVKNMMHRFNIPEDQPIENKLINRSLETAQQKIEGFNFDARKRVLAYDDVMNTQRHAIYARRLRMLTGSAQEIESELAGIMDGFPELEAIVSERKLALGEEFTQTVRRLLLSVTDMLWVEHLEAMEHMRGSVNLRAYGQRDPLVEYQKEGRRLFTELEEAFAREVRRRIPGIGEGAFKKEKTRIVAGHHELRESGGSHETSETRARPHVRTEKKYGRNDLVKITNGSETKEMKFKKAAPLIDGGGWKLVR